MLFELWCLEKTLGSSLDNKEVQPVHPKGNRSWIFLGRTDAEPETPILWPPDANNWLIWKDPDAGKHWWQEEKGTTEDEMVGWHHQLNGHKLEQAPRVGDGQGGLACCSPWGCKELDMTERLNWTDVRNQYQMIFEKIPHIFKCSATFTKRDLGLSYWKPLVSIFSELFAGQTLTQPHLSVPTCWKSTVS